MTMPSESFLPNQANGEPIDKVQRGNYALSVPRALTWIGLRVLHTFVQYRLLIQGRGDDFLSRMASQQRVLS